MLPIAKWDEVIFTFLVLIRNNPSLNVDRFQSDYSETIIAIASNSFFHKFNPPFSILIIPLIRMTDW
ncbi:hypothetical protein D0X99_18975 [Algoriphagus lacus]|uniref:Uncharacterized protein n=1 Tax=Algoriphagus lacus TaxID=2056311 RepID=A0A418PMV6_9BACT|nr:hypothetical protein D0X99_18975 [Algoriphagus lacus]